MTVPVDTPQLLRDYEERLRSSRELHLRASALAGSAAHDAWSVDPFPVYFDRADGPWKFDVDGRPVIDFWMGHGALLCGHRHPPVEAAIIAQASRATHLGGAHPLQVEWAERVISLIPSAEAVRFVSSGSEATLLALRIARAFTGRDTIIRITGHFHGWHDEALASALAGTACGINPGTAKNIVAVAHDIEQLRAALTEHSAAAVILEPGGGGAGTLPWSTSFLSELRRLCDARGTLLIFDEVVSAFRYAPGGVQSLSGVLPDLTVLAKVLAGGLPGGAVAGARNVMRVFGEGAELNGRAVRVPHTGTFNANPLAAAAGVAMLDSIADGTSQAVAERAVERLVRRVNASAERLGLDVRLFSQSSIFHIAIGGAATGVPAEPSPQILVLHQKFRTTYTNLRRALLIEGVDSHLLHGWTSSTHTDAVIDEAGEAFHRALERLRATDPVPRR